MEFSLNPIGVIHSCFKEKFGIPRQPGLVPAARAVLELFTPYGSPESLRGLSEFSHIWIVFIFHANWDKGWKSTVRPPRLGGNKRIGVFASRSGFRPNGVGMSAVKLDRVCTDSSICSLHLSGVDILDQTPVLDIKPYIPYSDSIPIANASFAAAAPPHVLSVRFSTSAETVCRDLEKEIPSFRQLIVQILQNDPRPAYYKDGAAKKNHGIRLYEYEIKWKCVENQIVITAIESSP